MYSSAPPHNNLHVINRHCSNFPYLWFNQSVNPAIFTLSNVFTAFSVSGISSIGTHERFIFDKNITGTSLIPITEND